MSKVNNLIITIIIGVSSAVMAAETPYVFPHSVCEKSGVCCNDSVITVPDSVTSIPDYAFADCSNLKRIILPAGLKSIGDYAFLGCESRV